MKFRLTLTVTALSLGAATLLLAADQPAAPAAPPATAPAVAVAPKFTDAQLLEFLGFILGQNSQMDQFNFTPDELASVTKGLAVAATGKESPYKENEIGPQFSDYVKARLKAGDVVRVAAQKKFLDDVKQKKGVIVTTTGLAYEIVQPGTGAFPKATDTVRVNYTGTFIDGKKFDSNADHDGGAPAEFPLNQVVPGWTEGIQKINKGGKIKLYVPADLAYGEKGNQGIPPSSTLVFDVELIEINPPATPAK